MSKAILVIDMPECCICCPCYNSDGLCWAKERIVKDDFKKPSWCPLKPLPTREPEKAISIEWILNYVSIWISEPYKNFVLNMINVWEKENEAVS